MPGVSAPATPPLHVRTPSVPVAGAALLLHGGRVRGTSRVPPWSVAYLRMRPFADRLGRDGAPAGLAVALLRHLQRGWNGDQRSPVADARWALDEIRTRFGDVPVALIGHSMGGRTALAVADDPSVRTVVALAPWIEPGDSVEPVTGRNLLIVHGTNDRMTNPGQSARFAEAAAGRAAHVSFVSVAGERHAMLRRPGFWSGLASAYTIETLFHRPPAGTEDAEITNVVAAALADTPVIRV